MRQVTARILEGQKVLAEGIRVWFHEATRAGLQSWYGHFEIEYLPQEIFDGQGPFEIKMSDGRSGKLLVKNVELAANPVSVSIVSTGPLK